MKITIATDGSCHQNKQGKRNGGWAWVSEDGRHASGGALDTTNNKMELYAVFQAILAHPEGHLHIQSDSQYVINALTVWHYDWRRRGWKTAGKKPVSNSGLIRQTLNLMDGRTVTFEWIRGHAGHPLNERADQLAGEASAAVVVSAG